MNLRSDFASAAATFAIAILAPHASGQILRADLATNRVAQGSSPGAAVTIGPISYFTADDGIHGRELWRSDGTLGGTALVKDIMSGSNGSDPAEITVLAGVAYFAASSDTIGSELWRTNGTPTGTTLVADIASGSASSSPRFLVPWNGRLWFTANGTGGNELWRTDGTSAGTARVADIHPSGSASPATLIAAPQGLFFAADDGVAGHELFDASLDRFGTGAATAVFGTGCPGTDGLIPTIEPSAAPTLSNAAFAITTWDVLPGADAVLSLGAGSRTLPLGGACSSYVDTLLLSAGTRVTPLGFAAFAMPIPMDPALLGVELCAQFTIVDPAGAWQGVAAFSPGLWMRLGL